MEKYNPQKIEKKWRKIWEEKGAHKTNLNGKRPYYCLDMFPYPSGEGLHVGHWSGYVLSDVWARYKKMQGYDVLHPMGWDAFGLPAENLAIKKGLHPKKSTEQNIKRMKKQLKQIGAMYDWSLELSTADPDYYKWTQWIFLQLYKKGLAFRQKAPVNWCPKCLTVLANEQVISGRCERCDTEVTKKELVQWFFKIRNYAERLLSDLKKLSWPEKVKTMQKNWIGKSEGVIINFKGINFELKNGKGRGKIFETEFDIPVFTTRPDTIYGVTYLVLAPEHPLVLKLTTADRLVKVKNYIERAKKISEIERASLEREKTGVFLGTVARNPINSEKIPIWISDYVLYHYGTGAVMAVPAHDQRDFEFAKKFGLEIKEVIAPGILARGIEMMKRAYEDEGYLVNSGEFSGLTSRDARVKITDYLEAKGLGKRSVNYKLRDWLISRQRYWGTPIPIIYCPNCGEVPVPENDLPVLLPEQVDFKPKGTGESPLAKNSAFVWTKCPRCKRKARRETDTMDTFVDSSWYYLRYPSVHEKKRIFDPKITKRWLPVDQYVGGVEHAILHLLYSRFITKFLYDLKLIDFDEPFKALFNQGMIYYKGSKMSKSRGNVVNPDDLIQKFGTDTVRGYELFMGPPEQDKEWNDKGVEGVFRFLSRVWGLCLRVLHEFNASTKKSVRKDSEEVLRAMHQTIKKVTEDIERFRLNVVLSTLMSYTNFLERNVDVQKITKKPFEVLLLLLAPIAPHLSEELWQRFGHKESIFKNPWPIYDPKLAKAVEIELVIQVNGKLRDKIKVSADITEDEAKAISQDSEKVKKHISGKIKKIIFVKGKLINIVTK